MSPLTALIIFTALLGGLLVASLLGFFKKRKEESVTRSPRGYRSGSPRAPMHPPTYYDDGAGYYPPNYDDGSSSPSHIFISTDPGSSGCDSSSSGCDSSSSGCDSSSSDGGGSCGGGD